MRQASAKIEGERKPVTILFTDIVGSTSHAERIDPEDWREIVSTSHHIVSNAVYHYEGTIAQLLGDGVLAFFGAPITHEDDPLRAVHAALDIQADIASYAQKITTIIPDFQVRIGITTGTVVLGNLGDDLHMEYLAIGDAVNLAARLQSAAQPGKILIANQTQRLVQHTVELQDLGEISLKGKIEPVRVYQVESLKLAAGHGRIPQGMQSSLVGRQAELNALLNTSAAVQAGLGRVVVVAGEPGLGKSRLLAEWRLNAGDQLRWVECATLSYGQGLPYHLLIDLLRNLLGVSVSAEEAELNQSLAAQVAELFGPEEIETYAFLGHLLSIQLSGAGLQVLRGLDPLTLRTQYIAALRRILLAFAERQPLALIFEDIHWADQASVEVLNRLVPLAREAALLFCFTARPEQETPGWALVNTSRNILGAGLVELDLQPLSPEEVECLTANLLAADDLPEGLEALVFEKAEGNPLFVEEVINALVEAGALVRQDGRLVATGDLAKVDIPDNLKRLVLARIDRLAEEPKRTLRVAAVIGREFLVRLLDAVLVGVGQAEPRPRLLSQLSTLEATSLIQLAATRPEIGYLFRHALVQEAAYEAVLRADRRRLHQAAAEALEQLYPERLDELAATLAYHFEQAQDRRRSLIYLERAGDGARMKYANAEAISLYRAAIEQAQALCEVGELSSESLADLYEKLGNVQFLIGLHESGRASFEQALAQVPPEQTLRRARCQRQIGNGWMLPREFAKALATFDIAGHILGEPGAESTMDLRKEWLELQLDRLWALYWMNDVPGMDETIRRIRPEIETYGSPSQLSTFYGRLVTLAFRRDRYVISDKTLEYARLAKETAQEAARQTGELNNLMHSPFILGFTYLWRGDFGEAEANLLEGLTMAERTGNQEQLVLMPCYLVTLYRFRQDTERAQELLPRALQAAQEAKIPTYIGLSMANQGWIYLQQGDLEQAESELKAAQAYFPPNYPLYSIYAFPLIAIFLPRSQLKDAIELARKVIHPLQRKLPEPLEATLQAAIQAFEAGDQPTAAAQLEHSIQLTRDLNTF
jgi:class 3 adenylate cyclase/tetratricopeptide (TPR) repeat protein